jgi:hypothetical protein
MYRRIAMNKRKLTVQLLLQPSHLLLNLQQLLRKCLITAAAAAAITAAITATITAAITAAITTAACC